MKPIVQVLILQIVLTGCFKAGTYYEDKSIMKDNCNYW